MKNGARKTQSLTGVCKFQKIKHKAKNGMYKDVI